uniref:Uncharacterized protein n=1 Tax=Spongospora subterranea TaxID=70186 RepID=A0A0H5QIT0_9EUKA|eukprot:CRZ01216.1 hypothetical protein [Spongospora subterranea]
MMRESDSGSWLQVRNNHQNPYGPGIRPHPTPSYTNPPSLQLPARFPSMPVIALSPLVDTPDFVVLIHDFGNDSFGFPDLIDHGAAGLYSVLRGLGDRHGRK